MMEAEVEALPMQFPAALVVVVAVLLLVVVVVVVVVAGRGAVLSPTYP
jgi:hypothetical protein